MIITTNIPLTVMQKATDLDDRRIYDRILEVCVPVVFGVTVSEKPTLPII